MSKAADDSEFVDYEEDVDAPQEKAADDKDVTKKWVSSLIWNIKPANDLATFLLLLHEWAEIVWALCCCWLLLNLQKLKYSSDIPLIKLGVVITSESIRQTSEILYWNQSSYVLL